jgi:hypothetical protein
MEAQLALHVFVLPAEALAFDPPVPAVYASRTESPLPMQD